ncbi:MAG: hypothetical protein RL033_7091 [Pseudomonadota bacterium]|jgi:hypothetical protein
MSLTARASGLNRPARALRPRAAAPRSAALCSATCVCATREPQATARPADTQAQRTSHIWNGRDAHACRARKHARKAAKQPRCSFLLQRLRSCHRQPEWRLAWRAIAPARRGSTARATASSAPRAPALGHARSRRARAATDTRRSEALATQRWVSVSGTPHAKHSRSETPPRVNTAARALPLRRSPA